MKGCQQFWFQTSWSRVSLSDHAARLLIPHFKIFKICYKVQKYDVSPAFPSNSQPYTYHAWLCIISRGSRTQEQGLLYHSAEPTRSRWNHIEDLDSFFTRIYKYHARHGFLCMALQETFDLIQFTFIVFLTTYLIHGINYAILFNWDENNQQKHNTISDIVYPFSKFVENFTTITWFFIVIATATLCLKFLIRGYQIMQFWDIKQFFNKILQIKDCDLDNLTWHEIQSKIKEAQLEHQMCIHKKDLTELDIYHRILRQENYMIALVNKRLLPPRFNLPFIGECVYWTTSLRYNIQTLLFWTPWSPFESSWHLREEYKRQHLRHELAARLSKQILILALINLIFAPLIFVWQVLYTFYGYAELIKREPGRVGIRHWSLYGKLYLRHFNELDHELLARLSRAYRPASKYLAAFSSPVVTVIAQHLAFICGALLSVLVILTLYDDGVIAVDGIITLATALATLTAIFRGLIPDEATIWCPESLLQGVVMHTHYLPPNWKGYAHTSKIKEEFQQLFQYRFASLIEELVSPLLTPFLLWRWIYPRSLDIVDFFRNFTVSVVGVGDVCSFAQMDIKKHGNPDWQAASIQSVSESISPDQYTQAEDGKVELSLVHFTTTNPSWKPPTEALAFVEEINELIKPQIQDSNVMFFASYQNFLDMSSMADINHYSDIMSMAPRSTASAFVGARSGGMSEAKMAASTAEGPDALGPISMTSSALALHDRYFQNRQKLSYEPSDEMVGNVSEPVELGQNSDAGGESTRLPSEPAKDITRHVEFAGERTPLLSS
ncbi:hypothetical protein NQ317_006533 [Molorchus minor]|uniref:Autophagy-related protein 9 n=1 Tax=Molorchus minor TaxID=1323400 RepID=A0ABQ9J8I1_9CUCU|nr:hypothetical protein NQ317_006533 [Molorchus minor]